MSKALILTEKRYLPAGRVDSTPTATMWSYSSSLFTPPSDSQYSGSNVVTTALSFASSSKREMSTSMLLPGDVYLNGGVSIKICWASSDVSSGVQVVWRVSTGFSAQGSTPDPTFNAAQPFQDAPTSSAAYGLRMVTKSSLTTTGGAAGSLMWIKVARDSAASSSDTLASSALFFGAELTYSRLVTLT